MWDEGDEDPADFRVRIADPKARVIPALGEVRRCDLLYLPDHFPSLITALRIVQSRKVKSRKTRKPDDRVRAAELVSSVTRLPLVAAVLFFAVGARVGGGGGVLWALLCVFLTSGLSLVYLYRLVRSGQVADARRISRSERIGPLRVVAFLHVFAFLLLTVLGGPVELRAILLSFAVATVALTLLTPVTNPSLHVAGISGAAVCVSYVFGGVAVPITLLILPVWWARSVLGRHTPLELALGMLLGAGATYLAFQWFL